MAGDEHGIGALAAGHLEPRQVTRWRIGNLTLGAEFHFARRGTETHAGHGIYDDSHAIPANEFVGPLRRLAAPHVCQRVVITRSAQQLLYLGGQCARLDGSPLRQQAGMHEAIGILDVTQRAFPEPVEQIITVGRSKNLVEGIVLAAPFLDAFGNHQQVKVMIAEHRDSSITKRFDVAKRRQRIGTAIDEIANQPQAVLRGIEGAPFEQIEKGLMTALDVTNCVGTHAVRRT